jgi:hypothetical protein
LVKALFPEIDLPKALQELSESNRLWREELQVIRARLEQMDERLGRIEVRQEQVDERLGRIEVRQEQADERLGRMENRQERMDGRLINVERSVADLKGSSYENDIRSKANAIFGYLLRRGHDARNEIGARLDVAEQVDQITGDDYTQVLASDLLWSGQLKGSNEPTTLVVEVSWWAEVSDLERAMLRAAILQKLGLRAIPVVAAREWSDRARQEAQRRGVVVVEQFSVDRSSWKVESIH